MPGRDESGLLWGVATAFMWEKCNHQKAWPMCCSAGKP